MLTGGLEASMQARKKSYEQLVSKLEQSLMKLQLATQKAQAAPPAAPGSSSGGGGIAQGLLSFSKSALGI